MILTEEQRIALMTSEYNASDYRWPNYTIPIQFNESHSSEQNAEILSAIDSIESVSCVRFSNRTDETNYVQITVCMLDKSYFMPQMDLVNFYRNSMEFNHIFND